MITLVTLNAPMGVYWICEKKSKRTWPKETIKELPVGSTSREILIASDVARS